jgi:hypothetical protein
VLGEYVANKKAYELRSVDGAVCREEDTLLGVLINDHQDSHVSR